MSIFKQRYLIHGWENDCKLTAKELYERIMADSKSDYKWIAPARELARICKESNFPKEYATAIKVAILNAYANVEHRANCGGVIVIAMTQKMKRQFSTVIILYMGMTMKK